MISHEHKFIFVHIPRTGGTSIEQQFGHNLKNGRKHWNLQNCKNYLDYQTFNNYFKFSFVRNPWSRMVSLYHKKQPRFTNNLSFKEYVKAVLIKEEKNIDLTLIDRHAINHADTYTGYWFKNTTELNYIGLFENRVKDLEYISSKIGIVIDIKHKANNSTVYKKHYTEYYDDETRE